MTDKKIKILNRISRIEGQIRGVKRLIENDKSCNMIISQVMAIREAVSSLGIEIIKEDIKCAKPKELDNMYLKNIFKIK